MKRNIVCLAFSLIVSAIFILTSCGGGPSATSTTATSGPATSAPPTSQAPLVTTAAAEKPKYGGTITLVVNADPAGQYKGGDWKGVTAKINDGYFNDLGVNTLWLLPFYPSPLRLEQSRSPRYGSGRS